MRKVILTILAGIFLIPFLIFTTDEVKAASLSKNEIAPGEYFDIYGDGFGSYASSYSYVCFSNDSNCFGSTAFLTLSGWSWTNTRITLYMPSGMPLSGDIIIYGRGKEDVCYYGYCSSYDTSVELFRLTYKVKPVIYEIEPSSIAEPGRTIRISGDGFGDYGGSVYFDSYRAPIVNWSYKAIDVKAPKEISSVTNNLVINSQNGLSTSIPYTINKAISNDTYSHYQDYLEQIELSKAWGIENSSNEVVVAVIDDGIYINHPDLLANMWRNTKEVVGNGIDDDNNGYVDDVYGWDFVDNVSEMTARGSHGTMVAGIIGAIRNNSEGITGIAKNVKLMSVIVCDNVTGCNNEAISKGIYYAVDNGADIINLSLGTTGTIGYTNYLNSAIQYAYDNNIVVVVAAGNGDIEGGNGQNLNLIPQSSVCNNNGKEIILGVAALNNLYLDGTKKTDWSNYGSNCVNISAPGARIVSTSAPAYVELGNYYAYGNGTSFSAPIVAGVAAMVKSKYPTMKNWEIIDRLIYTSDNIDSSNPSYKGQIGGRVNAYRALNDPFPEPKLISVSPKQASIGDKVNVKVKNYNIKSSIRLVGGSVDMKVPNNYIQMQDRENMELTIPPNLKSDSYTIKIRYSNRDVSILNNVLDINGTSGSSDIQQDAPESRQPQVLGEEYSAPWVDLEESLFTYTDWSLVNRFKGQILLQVEEHGEAWYLDPISTKKYYLKDGPTAYEALRKFGLGITDADLAKIPVGLEERFEDIDSDRDGLADQLEEGLKTNPNKADTDGDGVNDGVEVLTNNTNPLGSGRLYYDNNLVNQLKGRIVLQVESHGEAWYINPKDGKRYYMKDGDAAYQIMRFLSSGMFNVDLRKIPVGRIE